MFGLSKMKNSRAALGGESQGEVPCARSEESHRQVMWRCEFEFSAEVKSGGINRESFTYRWI